jgi:hypothetical protein
VSICYYLVKVISLIFLFGYVDCNLFGDYRTKTNSFYMLRD